MNDNIEMIEIFMTDGNPTVGQRDEEQLINNVKTNKDNNNYKQYFIGFGQDHSSTLLEGFAKQHNSTYDFIDNYETCGMVYGEILYKISNHFKDSMTIELNKCLIYNYKNNTWDASITVYNVSYDSETTFIIRSETDSPFIQTISNLENRFKQKIEINTNYTNVINYLWRQKTLEYLYDSKNNIMPNALNNELLEHLKEYMHKTNQTENNFLKVLCDDIYITMKLNNSHYKNTYITARQSSQGEQKGYTAKNVSHLLPDDWDNISLDDQPHILSQNSDTPFLSRTRTKISRSISAAPASDMPPPPQLKKRRPPSLQIPSMGKRQNPSVPDYSNMHA